MKEVEEELPKNRQRLEDTEVKIMEQVKLLQAGGATQEDALAFASKICEQEMSEILAEEPARKRPDGGGVCRHCKSKLTDCKCIEFSQARGPEDLPLNKGPLKRNLLKKSQRNR